MASKIAVITGAGTGIGKASALALMRNGWSVVLSGRRKELLEDVAREGQATGQKSLVVPTDVADPAAIRNLFVRTKETFGRLDLLFNNAGIGSAGAFEELSMDHNRAIIAVNFQGVVNGCHAAFQYLHRTPGARVISMSSASALSGAPGLASYAATKFAVKGLTEALDIEWRRHSTSSASVSPFTANLVAQ